MSGPQGPLFSGIQAMMGMAMNQMLQGGGGGQFLDIDQMDYDVRLVFDDV